MIQSSARRSSRPRGLSGWPSPPAVSAAEPAARRRAVGGLAPQVVGGVRRRSAAVPAVRVSDERGGHEHRRRRCAADELMEEGKVSDIPRRRGCHASRGCSGAWWVVEGGVRP